MVSDLAMTDSFTSIVPFNFNKTLKFCTTQRRKIWPCQEFGCLRKTNEFMGFANLDIDAEGFVQYIKLKSGPSVLGLKLWSEA